MIKSIVITAKEKQTKDGKKFLTYSARKTDGTKVAIKFRSEVENKPKKAGRYVCGIESTAMNRTFTDYGETWWVRENCETIEEYIPEDLAKDEF